MNKRGNRPLYFKKFFTDERIEQLPEDVRRELNLRRSPRTHRDWIEHFIDHILEADAEPVFNFKDLQYYVWANTDEMPPETSLRSAIIPLIEKNLVKRIPNTTYMTFIIS